MHVEQKHLKLKNLVAKKIRLQMPIKRIVAKINQQKTIKVAK